MKDNFSTQAGGYAAYRPHYPQEMIQYIMSFVSKRHAALDLATGNGQVAAALAPYFDAVYATDISAKQLDNAKRENNIYYSIGNAEETGFENDSFDLITVAQAVHWFKFDAFYKEVKRILKPDGLFAILGYGLLQTNKDADAIILHLYRDILGEYWDAERHYIDENYTTIPFPLFEIGAEKFYNHFTWSFDHLVGYFNTWSAVQHYIKQHGENPIDHIKEELKIVWEASDKQVMFPLLLRLGKIE